MSRITQKSQIKNIAKVTARFTAKQRLNAETGCLEWQGKLSADGYGRLGIAGTDGDHRMYRVHRLAWLLEHGEMPAEGLVLRHKCDNPRCVNVSHLETGTQAQNMQDRDERGRQFHRRGETNGRALLTADQVRAIRAAHASGTPQVALARNYGVTISAVWKIVRGLSWTHV